MKYKVTFTIQKEVSVIIDISDEKINKSFTELGVINSNSDFIDEYDDRWEIEQLGYEAYSSVDDSLEETEEEIVDRTVRLLEAE